MKTAKGDAFDAANVILAMGTQGNPRKLGVPGEDLPHVRYRLVDPAEHRDQDLLVVGAGDSALEIAIALSDENRVGLIVRGPEITRANEVLTKEVLARQATRADDDLLQRQREAGLSRLRRSHRARRRHARARRS